MREPMTSQPQAFSGGQPATRGPPERMRSPARPLPPAGVRAAVAHRGAHPLDLPAPEEAVAVDGLDILEPAGTNPRADHLRGSNLGPVAHLCPCSVGAKDVDRAPITGSGGGEPLPVSERAQDVVKHGKPLAVLTEGYACPFGLLIPPVLPHVLLGGLLIGDGVDRSVCSVVKVLHLLRLCRLPLRWWRDHRRWRWAGRARRHADGGVPGLRGVLLRNPVGVARLRGRALARREGGDAGVVDVVLGVIHGIRRLARREGLCLSGVVGVEDVEEALDVLARLVVRLARRLARGDLEVRLVPILDGVGVAGVRAVASALGLEGPHAVLLLKQLLQVVAGVRAVRLVGLRVLARLVVLIELDHKGVRVLQAAFHLLLQYRVGSPDPVLLELRACAIR
mmetsp:Transcript_76502/g.203170  ORF Transcript_76502/g.203170 Transcript_76502/m.203170 type:complete len:394 (+) Transcript_76502:35-1216(+)